MTITLDLTPAEEAQLVAAAQQEGIEPAAFLYKLVSRHLPLPADRTFAQILAPVHEYSQEQGFTDEEIGGFVDAEVTAYRAERRDRQAAKTGE